MHPPQIDGLVTAGSERSHGFWRAALSGLTPQVIAIIAALLWFRMLSANGDEVVVAANNHELGAWFRKWIIGYCDLLIMTAPMLVVVIATANIAPKRGPRRIAALAVAVVLSAGVGVLLRIVFVDWRTGGDASGMLPYVWPRYALLGGMLTVVGEFYRRELASTEAMHRAEIDRAAFEREMAEARLQVLQARSNRTSCSTRWPTYAASTTRIMRPAEGCWKTSCAISKLPCPGCGTANRRLGATPDWSRPSCGFSRFAWGSASRSAPIYLRDSVRTRCRR
jgi:hypothetical protein